MKMLPQEKEKNDKIQQYYKYQNHSPHPNIKVKSKV